MRICKHEFFLVILDVITHYHIFLWEEQNITAHKSWIRLRDICDLSNSLIKLIQFQVCSYILSKFDFYLLRCQSNIWKWVWHITNFHFTSLLVIFQSLFKITWMFWKVSIFLFHCLILKEGNFVGLYSHFIKFSLFKTVVVKSEI